MEKFFCDLEDVLEKYNHDVTALDDYEVIKYGHTIKYWCKNCPIAAQVEVDFIRSIIASHFNQLKTKVVSVIDN